MANCVLSVLPCNIALNKFSCVLVFTRANTLLPCVKFFNSFFVKIGFLALSCLKSFIDFISYLSNKVLLSSLPPPGILSKPIPSFKLIVGFSVTILFITALFKSIFEKGSPIETSLLYSCLNRENYYNYL